MYEFRFKNQSSIKQNPPGRWYLYHKGECQPGLHVRLSPIGNNVTYLLEHRCPREEEIEPMLGRHAALGVTPVQMGQLYEMLQPYWLLFKRRWRTRKAIGIRRSSICHLLDEMISTWDETYVNFTEFVLGAERVGSGIKSDLCVDVRGLRGGHRERVDG